MEKPGIWDNYIAFLYVFIYISVSVCARLNKVGIAGFSTLCYAIYSMTAVLGRMSLEIIFYLNV